MSPSEALLVSVTCGLTFGSHFQTARPSSRSSSSVRVKYQICSKSAGLSGEIGEQHAVALPFAVADIAVAVVYDTAARIEKLRLVCRPCAGIDHRLLRNGGRSTRSERDRCRKQERA